MNARKDRQKPLKSTHHKDSLDSDVPESQVDRRKEKLGAYFMDVSKYVLTGVVITSLFKDVTDKVTIYLAGIFIVVLTLWAGLLLTNKYKKE